MSHADPPNADPPNADRAWSPRQRAMLREMGVVAWAMPARPAAAQAAQAIVPGVAATAIAVAAAVPAAAPAAPSAAVALPVPELRPASAEVAALDWPQLEASVAQCRACRLCEGRSNTVFGTGSQRAHWLVVGEAPGEEEDRRGEPFVGKSGQLLDAMLHAMGLSRAADTPAERAVYIANAVKCRPPGNRNPQPDELARCESFLLRQVALLQPRFILAMGRFAVQSLLRSDEPIGRLRGRLHRYQGVPLVVTYHPAYLLRSPQEKARAWDDLSRARAWARSGAPGAAHGTQDAVTNVLANDGAA